MPQQKTHRHVKNPQISARYLADFMAASETAKRTIVRNCKYPAIARVIQHDEAKLIVARFVRDGKGNVAALEQAAQQLRDRLTDNDFDRDLYDHNADYVDRFAKVYPDLKWPAADLLPPGNAPAFDLNGVRVTSEIHARLRRLTRTNKVRVGAVMLRYLKGKPLNTAVGDWQSAFIFGYLGSIGVEDGADVELQLCLTLDAYAGALRPAPGDSARRFQHMKAACETIAERWPNIQPPAGAVF